MIGLLSMMTAREGGRLSTVAESAWDREARALIAIVVARGIALRDEDLVYLDVRDLQTLRWRVEHCRGGRPARRPRAA